MYIELRNIRTFDGGSGTMLTLPYDIIRFVEFENVVVFLLNNENKREFVVGVKFSQEGGVNHFRISWEFKSIDASGKSWAIYGLKKAIYNSMEVVYCYSVGFSMGYYLNPDTGEVIYKEEIR